MCKELSRIDEMINRTSHLLHKMLRSVGIMEANVIQNVVSYVLVIIGFQI